MSRAALPLMAAGPEFGPLIDALGAAAADGFAHIGWVNEVSVYRNAANGRDLALDPSGRAFDLYAGGYWPVSRAGAIRYALGETDERPMP